MTPDLPVNAGRRARQQDRAEAIFRLVVADGATLQEAGQRHGITRERVRQIVFHEARRRCWHKNTIAGYGPDAWRSLEEMRMYAVAAAKDQDALARYFRAVVVDIRHKGEVFLQRFRRWQAGQGAAGKASNPRRRRARAVNAPSREMGSA